MGQKDREPATKWHYKAEIITACNCDWGCPCNFDTPPTKGYCEGGWGFKIERGTYGDLRLDGLDFAYMAQWPRAIHEGQGTAKLWIDAKASKEQRRALEKILKGEAGGKPWPIFAKTVDKWLETSFANFEWKFDGAESRYKIGEDVQVVLERMRNPVTGADFDARILLPDALVCHELNVTSTKSFGVFANGMRFADPGKNAWYGTSEHAN